MSTTIIAELAAILGVPAGKAIAQVRYLHNFRIDVLRIVAKNSTPSNVLNDTLAAATAGTTSRYDWSQISDDYNWAATDADGTVYVYENRPIRVGDGMTNAGNDGVWWNDHRDADWADLSGSDEDCKECPDWRDSLEQRPA